MAKWNVEIDGLPYGGFAANYWNETYPRHGEANEAATMQAMDLTNTGYIQPGFSPVEVTGSPAVSSTIWSMDLKPGSSQYVFGIGSSTICQINAGSATAITDHTISATTAYTYGQSIKTYGDNMYYAWSTTSMSDIGKYTVSADSYNDSWWTGTLSATALGSVPVSMEIGANGTLYFSNGRYVGSFDGTTAQDKALDLPTEAEIKDVIWMQDRLFIPASLNGAFNYKRSSIYIWDGTTDSWETEIPVIGKVGSGLAHNGVYFQFYQTNYKNKLAYLDGSKIIDLFSYSKADNHDVPAFYQTSIWNDFIVWVPGVGSKKIFAYGPLEKPEKARAFEIVYDPTGSGTKSGGIFVGAQTPYEFLVSFDQKIKYIDTDYYETTNSFWKSLMYDITSDDIRGGDINGVRINFEKLVSGSVLDWSLVNSQGTTIYSDTISYAKATASPPLHTLTSAYYPLNGKKAEDFRVELDYSNGSPTAPVRIKNIKIYGES